MKGLIVVDMQNSFLETGDLPVKGASSLAKNIYDFISKLNRNEWKIIATQDWHPKQHCSFCTFNAHCIKRTNGAKLIEPLNEFNFDKTYKKGKRKNKEEFSIFTRLENSKAYKYLKKQNINEVYVIGLVKEICVFDTYKDLANLGFNAYIIDELSIPLSENDYINIKDQIKLIKLDKVFN